MPRLRVGDHHLYYVRRRRAASAEPLLLIQGLSGNLRHWGEPFLAALARHFDVVAYDHRGVGGSSSLVGSFTIADLADDAAQLLSALGVARAHIVGISMGGMVAQELALREPERVATLVLGCTSAGGLASRIAPFDVLGRLTVAYLSGSPRAIARAAWEVNVSARFAADEAAFAAWAQATAQQPASLPLLLAQIQAVAVHDASRRLGEIQAPTLVVHGTQDVMVPMANARALAELIPDARLELLDGVGHLFFWEQPQHTAELVRTWAARERVIGTGAPGRDPCAQ